MRGLAPTLILFMALLIIAAPAYGCGLYGYHPQVQAPPDPWIPLIIFAGVIFGLIFAGRSLPHLGQGALIGFSVMLAAGLGVFTFSSLFYPGAYIAKFALMIVAVLTALLLLGFKTKQDRLGLAKYGLGLFIGLLAYLPISSHIPVIKTDPTFGWVAAPPSHTTWDEAQSAPQETARPAFATSTKNITDTARLSAQSQTPETPEETSTTISKKPPRLDE